MTRQIGTLLIKGLLIRNTLHELESNLRKSFGPSIYYIKGNSAHTHIVKINTYRKTLQLMQYDSDTDTIIWERPVLLKELNFAC